MAVPDAGRARVLADFEADRERDRTARAASAAEADAKRATAIGAFVDKLTRLAAAPGRFCGPA